MPAGEPAGVARRRSARTLLVLALLACAACATTRTATAPGAQNWEQRLAALQAIGSFDLQGRVAASDGHQGFSAGLRWHQQGPSATLDLAAPMGFGAAHVEQSPDGLSLTTSQGVTLTGDAASRQFAATLGFEPPLGSLRYWVLGASDPTFPAQETVDDQQRLTHLEQDGWSIDCSDYAVADAQWLPRRVVVTRQSLHLTLIVHAWQL